MKQRGATLVELMIALAIGAIVVAAVTTLLFQTKKNYTIQDSMARLQENARFAMQFIVRDLRMAGYFGCMDDVTSVFNHVDGGAGSLFDGGSPIDGYEQGDDDWRPSGSTAQISSIVSGTDAIALRYLDGAGNIPIEEPYMPNVSAALHLAANNGLKKGDVIAVTDCSSADIFQITGPAQGNVDNGILNHNTGVAGVAPGNASKPLSKTYEDDSLIMKLTAVRYFIGRRGNDAANPPGLFRESLRNSGGTVSEVTEELVEGIENMQILYGVDKSNNKIPNIYVAADEVESHGTWSDVVAVRVVLLAYSIAANATGGSYVWGAESEKSNLVFSSDSDDAVDNTTTNRKRRRFVATVSMRNLK